MLRGRLRGRLEAWATDEVRVPTLRDAPLERNPLKLDHIQRP